MSPTISYQLLRYLEALLLSFAVAMGQSNLGTISGVVSDATGAVIPAATVTARNLETNTEFSTQTNEAGAFVISSLLPGPYAITFKAPGFQSVERSILLEATQKVRVDVQLSPGPAERVVVEVQAAAPVIRVDSGEIGKTIETRLLRDMPVQARNVYQVLQLIPGITARAHNTNPLDGPGQKYSDSSISGSRPNTNAMTQDGVPANQVTGFLNLPYGPLEPIQEIRILTNAYSAEFGRYSGAQIVLQTKSGTQHYRGTVYAFVRNGIFNANRWENNANGYLADGKTPRSPRPDFAWQQVGGSLGGPVPKLRNTFFYLNLENENGSNPNYPSATVAPVAIRGGNFSSLTPWGVLIRDPLNHGPFPGNVIPPARLDPVAQKIVAAIPEPNAPGTLATNSRSGIPSSNYVAPVFDAEDPIFTVTTRLDTYPGNANRVYVSWQRLNEGPDTNPTPFPNFLNNTRKSREAWQYRLAAGFTRIFSPTLSNESVVGFQRYRRVEVPPNVGQDIGAMLGIRNRFGPGMPIISISGMTGFGRNYRSTTVEFPLTVNNYTSYIRKTHGLKFGIAMLRYSYSAHSVPNNAAGSYSFNGDMTSAVPGPTGALTAPGRGNEAYAFADFLLGAVYSASVDFGLPKAARYAYNFGVFINDDWKAGRRLTVNLGLRWDYETQPVVSNDMYSRVDPYTGGLLVAGRRGVSRTLNLKSPVWNLAPRLGAALSLSKRTVLRTGFGIFYGSPFADMDITRPGFNSAVSIPTLGIGVPQPFTLAEGINVPGLRPGVTDPFEVYGRATTSAPFSASRTKAGKEPMPYNVHWNLSITRNLPLYIIADVAYVANRGVHQPQDIPGNNPVISQAAEVNARGAQAFRPFPLLSAFDVLHYNGTSAYHALQVKVSRRFSSGFALDAVYTFSKMTDSASPSTGATSSRSLGNTQIFWQFPELEHALSDFDRPHLLTAALLWELPFGEGRSYLRQTRLLKHLFGGWQVSGVFRYQSGATYTVSQQKMNNVLSTQRPDAIDPSRLNGRLARPNYLKNPDGGNGRGYRILAPCGYNPKTARCEDPESPFQPSSALWVGTVGRNTARDLGSWHLDAGLFREFHISEFRRIHVRAEAFNVLNATQFRGLGSTDITSTTYGITTSTYNPRNLQLGIRFNF